MSDNEPMTLTEFLEARITEDEEIAAPDPDWDDYKGHCDAVGVHYTSARVRAECVAKRAIVEQAEEASSNTEYVISQSCINQAEKDEARASDPGRRILHALASVYADHPDYDPAWAD